MKRAKIAALTAAITLAGGALTASAAIGPAAASATAVINGSATFQRITGFGASEAFGQASTVMNAPAAVQRQVLSLLYGPSGAALTILRNRVSADPGTTIEPTAPASPAATPSYISLAAAGQDQGQLWFARQIRRRYGVTRLFADAWSAPGFMKPSGNPFNGGPLCGVPGATCSSGDWRQAYANYLVQYAKDYAAAGMPLTYIGPVNEPDFTPNGYDGMTLTPSQMTSLLDVLGPTVASSGLRAQMSCCAATGWPVSSQYAAAIEADPTALAHTAALTSHGYSGAPTTRMPGWTKPAWETEWSTFEKWDPTWDDGTDASGMAWAQHIYQGLAGANLNAFLYWWGSTTPTANGDNEGLVEINGSTVAASGRLWAFANFSRFVRPGAVRIGAASPSSGVELTAFRNTNGTIAVVALNTSASAAPMTFSLRGRQMPRHGVAVPHLTDSSHQVATQAPAPIRGGAFSATLPPRSLDTFTIHPGR